MFMIALHPFKVTILLTTSVFMLVAAVLQTWLMDTSEPKDIIGVTAAYAAVLIVNSSGG